MIWDDSLYIIEARNGLAKIGCARFPKTRLQAVLLHSPIPARLIAVWSGSLLDERELHRKFIKQRSHSEWFAIEGPFAEFVDSMRGRGLTAPIQAWPTIGEWKDRKDTSEQRRKKSEAQKAVWARKRTTKGVVTANDFMEGRT